jgi:hypothetical protein
MYSVVNPDRVVELTDLPQSSVGAPLPVVLGDEHVTLLAYIVQDKPHDAGGRVLTDGDLAMLVEQVALVEFKGCQSCMFGSPNDEAFAGHPLANRGLHPYSAFRINDWSWIRQLERMNSVHPFHKPERFQRLNHFVFAFHDSTFECVAEDFTVSVHQGSLESMLPKMQRRLQW